ncbi:ABC transporter ATP-binding protein [Thiomicrorhabdus indica]|uniref:ABC transporter ATP-binding protein n=1 Tax=Thiomicrorhabdus indica TaxID=2267253 RepID=UPI0013EE6652|nr:ABC transporter ATP-binding protein [Thiomicrorhabdus indica]
MNKTGLLMTQGLAAKHQNTMIFREVDLQIFSGEVIALLGQNGCGKTTLLRTLLGLHPKAAGEVYFDHISSSKVSTKERAKRVSYVPQVHKMAFGFPVIDMVLMATYGERAPWLKANAEHFDMAWEALKWMGIADLAHRPYTELSGGQRQMVLIARAFAQNTPMIFMDEPTNGLDFGNQIKLLEKIHALKASGKTVLFTTHHPEHAIHTACRALTMKNGSILSQGCPKETLDKSMIQNLYQLNEQQLKNHHYA